MSARTAPPFRADHVGSLLRPAALKEARAKNAKGEISAADLKTVEDREIGRVIRHQEDVGLHATTDGEFRRSWWHLDFLWGLDGVERHVMEQGVAFAAVKTRAEGIKVTVTDGVRLKVEGADKQLVGAVTAEIRSFYPPEPYKGKGVRIVGERVRRKEGKTVA